MFLKPQYWFQVTAGLRRRWRKDKKIAGERKRPIWGDLSDWPQSLHQTNNSQCTTKLAKGTEMINQLTDTFHFIFWEISNYCLLQSTGNNFGPVKYWLYITSFISFMCLPFFLYFSVRFQLDFYKYIPANDSVQPFHISTQSRDFMAKMASGMQKWLGSEARPWLLLFFVKSHLSEWTWFNLVPYMIYFKF